MQQDDIEVLKNEIDAYEKLFQTKCKELDDCASDKISLFFQVKHLEKEIKKLTAQSLNSNIIYAIKDLKTGLFYNRVHKNLKPLSQNTAFYKTKNSAKAEMNDTTQLGFVARKILDYQAVYSGLYKSDYAELNNYYKEHKDDIDLSVVKIEIRELINGKVDN